MKEKNNFGGLNMKLISWGGLKKWIILKILEIFEDIEQKKEKLLKKSKKLANGFLV